MWIYAQHSVTFLTLFAATSAYRTKRAAKILSSSHKLYKFLFVDYERHVKPRQDGTSVNVSVSLYPECLEIINEEGGDGTANFYLEIKWVDGYLKWDRRDFNGTECVFVPIKRIWVPNLKFVVNSVEAVTGWGERDVAHLCNDGRITKTTFARATITATYKVLDFPFDVQELKFFIGHDIAGTDEVDLFPGVETLEEILTIGYKPSTPPEWEIKDYQCRRDFQLFESEVYSSWAAIECLWTVQRRPGFYIMNFCIPCILVTVLSIIGIQGVALVVEVRKNKFKLAVTSFMSLSVLTLTIANGMPRTRSGVSRLHIFYYGLLSIIMLSTVGSLISIMWQRKQGKNLVPDIIDGVSLIVFLSAVVGLTIWFFAAHP